MSKYILKIKKFFILKYEFYKQKKIVQKRLEEIRKRDPYIYE